MSGAWRYTTINCVRVWRWYAHVGPAQLAGAAAACVGGGAALGLGLAAAPAADAPPHRLYQTPAVADAGALPGPLWAGDIPAYEIDGRRDAPAAGGVAAGGGRLVPAALGSVAPSWSPPAWRPRDQTPQFPNAPEVLVTMVQPSQPTSIAEPAAFLLLLPPIAVTIAARRVRQ